jgi:D-arabinose 1-dehydrogenase-like Zn-dependent alcohol dehydrogenase
MSDDDPHCPKHVFTYDGKYEDGHTSYGGYSEAVRVFEDFAIKIPDALPSDVAAPLLCAGATVWQPLVDHNVKWGTKVAVVGLGGLGHLAVMFAAKMGADVTVVTTTAGKADDSKRMGAKNVLVRTDKKAMADAAHTMDVVIITTNQEGQDYNELLSLCRTRGTAVLCAAPNDGIKFHPFSIIMMNAKLCGSLIASTGQIRAMLDFAAKNNVHPIIEKMPMKDVNVGVQKVRDGKVRYRVVLENPTH